jgi:DNA polymerase-3 subunit beta
VILVSTDGFRLSENSIPLKSTFSQEVILPKSVLSELIRLVGESDEISFSFNKKDNQVVFGVDGMILASRVLAGEFPDYKKRIPSTSKILVNIDKEEFVRAVKLSGIFAKDSANVVKLKVVKNGVEFEAQSKSSGSQETKVDAKVEGGELEIAFNFKFLDEVLNVFDGDEVQMELNDAASPGVFRDPKDKDFLHLIMPVKVQD